MVPFISYNRECVCVCVCMLWGRGIVDERIEREREKSETI